jgi:hypothetical protein
MIEFGTQLRIGNLPSYLKELAIRRCREYKTYHIDYKGKVVIKDDLTDKQLEDVRIHSAFVFGETSEGYKFWDDIIYDKAEVIYLDYQAEDRKPIKIKFKL